ncbi:unnamed protein product [Rhizoctonia solani]|uniref:Uncharacterized protein n=1 Tax=Rhizoctonia solani TaxID=456999 RepID=A0A8H3E921_9AGAM|nr:unnamed protein product [Rhizoctonia solani]
MTKYNSRPRKSRSPLQKAQTRSLAGRGWRRKKPESEPEVVKSTIAMRASSEPLAEPVHYPPSPRSLNDFNFLVNLVKEKAKESEIQTEDYKRAKQRERSMSSKIEKLQRKIGLLEEQLKAREARATTEPTLHKLAVVDIHPSELLNENNSFDYIGGGSAQ